MSKTAYYCEMCGKKHESYRPLKNNWRCVDCTLDFFRQYIHPMRGKAEAIRNRIIKERGEYCEECGKYELSIHMHHIIPLFNRGTNDDSNLILLCKKCHKEKHKAS